jgi:hypothetical protein
MVPPPPTTYGFTSRRDGVKKEDKNPLLPHRIAIYLRATPLFSLAVKSIAKVAKA